MEDRMNGLQSLSNDLAAAVERAGRAVFAVNGRARLGSTGVHWRPGLVVTADHTVHGVEEVTITGPDGRALTARVIVTSSSTCTVIVTSSSTCTVWRRSR